MTEDQIPTPSQQRAEAPVFLTETPFEAFDLPEPVLAGLTSAGFTLCTPIQEQTLQVSLTGRDVAGQAQTGTGKTAAFLVTVFTRLLTQPPPENKNPSVIIIAPTRELAQQIYEEARIIGGSTSFRLVQVVGGVDYERQARLLKAGVDVVICTPGRIIDYYKQGIFQTTGISMVVIDEADRLLDLGFAKDMRYILRSLPPYKDRQSMLFSATLSYRVLELTYEYMNLPEFISITPEEVTVEGINQSLFHVGKEKKLMLLLGLLRREDPQRCLIFVNTKIGVEWLTKKLKGNKWPAEGITGDLPQRKRFRLMSRFKSGDLKILIATDVASRGIHVEDVSHVINYDLPQDAENYVHRIGRTARAGKTGAALSLACENYVYHLEPLEEMLKFKIPVIWADDDWYVEDQAGPVNLPQKTKTKKSVKDKGFEKKPFTRNIPKALLNRPPGYFPGSFFGFTAPPPDKSKSKSGTTPRASAGKKRRRYRRKKKHPAAESTPSGTNGSST